MSRDQPRRCPATRVPQCGPPAAHLAVRSVVVPVVVAAAVVVVVVVVVVEVFVVVVVVVVKSNPLTGNQLQVFRSVGRQQHASLSGLLLSLQ